MQSRSIDLQPFNEFFLFLQAKKNGMNDFSTSSHEIIGILKITQIIYRKEILDTCKALTKYERTKMKRDARQKCILGRLYFF